MRVVKTRFVVIDFLARNTFKVANKLNYDRLNLLSICFFSSYEIKVSECRCGLAKLAVENFQSKSHLKRQKLIVNMPVFTVLFLI